MVSIPKKERVEYNRRSFVKVCISSVAAVGANPSLLAKSANTSKSFNPARLTDTSGKNLDPKELPAGVPYVFHYPYVTTPCFLINLGNSISSMATLATEDGIAYEWPGGTGPENSIVAFSAICAHKMSYPTRDVSFINYRHKQTNFINIEQRLDKKSQVIYCCSERSVYDPSQGCRVLGGPAPQPLASVLLDYDENTDSLTATGILGGDMFDRFFKNFEFRLALDHRITDVKQKTIGTTMVFSMDEYSEVKVMC